MNKKPFFPIPQQQIVKNTARNVFGMNSDQVMAMGMALMAEKQVEAKMFTDTEIHDFIFGAQDHHIGALEAVINKPKPFDEPRYTRLERLLDLGFESALHVSDVKAYKERLKNATNERETLREYELLYPTYKFISIDQVKLLCKRSALLLSEVKNYKSNIPEKNQEEIVNFSFKERHYRRPTEIASPFFWPEFDTSYIDFWRTHPKSSGGIDGLVSQIQGMMTEETKIEVNIPAKSMLILAPEQKLITKGNVKRGHLLINDPIPLQPVKYGYLIITAWGFEATDGAVVNPKNN